MGSDDRIFVSMWREGDRRAVRRLPAACPLARLARAFSSPMALVAALVSLALSLSGLVLAASAALAAAPASAATLSAATLSASQAIVTSASASPATVPAAGGTVTVTGTVDNATSCQLELLSSQSFSVVYSHNPRSCTSGTFFANVTIAPNPSLLTRTIAFALVATNGTSSYSGRFYVRLLPAPRALVTSASASPTTVPAAGGTVTVTGTVEHATSCQLELLSSQSFPVVYSHNPRSCTSGSFSAKVTVGSNPTKVKRVVAFALVAKNLASSFPGRFVVTLAARTVATTTAGAPPETTMVPTTEPPVSLSVTDSSNWSGYSAMGGPYTEAKGTFTVPGLASGAPLRTQVSEWVGLDGTSEADASLIQAGVDEYPDPQSPTGYDVQPWWEILPQAETTINMTVSAGDKVTVTIWQVSGTSWKINLTDDTTGASFTTPDEAYTGPGKSVEWIVEATTECPTQSSCHTAALAPFTPEVAFSGLGMTGTQATSVDDIVLMQGVQNVATPTPLTDGGFNVSYTGPPPDNL